MLFTKPLLPIVLASVVLVAAETGVEIHPNGNDNKCLDVKDGTLANNTPVQMSVASPTPYS